VLLTYDIVLAVYGGGMGDLWKILPFWFNNDDRRWAQGEELAAGQVQ